MKKLSNLEKAQKLNKEEQKNVFGGKAPVVPPPCKRPYLGDADGIHCFRSGGVPGIIKYYGGLDYCC